MRKPKNEPEEAASTLRLHFMLSPDTIRDLDALRVRLQRVHRSEIARAAIRCFREALDAGIVADSGQLILPRKRGR